MLAAFLAFLAAAMGQPTAAQPQSQQTPSAAPEERRTWGQVETVKIRDGERAVLIGPRTRSRRVVVYVHGSGPATAWLTADGQGTDLLPRLLDNGYWVAATGARGDNWGNPASVADNVALARLLRRRGFTRIAVVAESMGGLDGLLMLDHVRVDAWIGVSPVCDLTSMYRRELPQFRRSIRAAYRATNLGELRAAAGSRMPASPRRVRGLPMLFVHSAADTVVSKRANTDRCARAARRRGARVRVAGTAGEHGDRSAYRADRIVAFLRRTTSGRGKQTPP